MDFVVGLPKTRKGFDSIWAVVDKMTKSTQFLPIKTTYGAEDYARLYIHDFVRLHGVLFSIISARGEQFTSSFKSPLSTFTKNFSKAKVCGVEQLSPFTHSA